MLTFIAYALLVFGIPIVIGGFASMILIVILDLIIGEKWKKIHNSIFEIIDGIAAIVIAILMFNLLKTIATFFIPIILSVVSFIWFSSRKEKSKSIWNIIGIWCGWTFFLLL